ncbi:MAG TPA: sulfopyruvate decarboxylase subunit alpha [Nitrospirota bacterium]|nr:sulfopyruvate decarboxylase subunit alpha [Nitrospirota bacterium]
MPHPEEDLITILRENGVNFTASLPCEKFKTLLAMLPAAFPHIALTREEEGVGIAGGAALAGKRPALFVQSSGVGNMINALLSLTVYYRLPLALFVSRRGIYKEKIDAQLPMGLRLPGILEGAGIAFSDISEWADLAIIGKKLGGIYEENSVHAFLLSPEVWEGSECSTTSSEFKVHGSKCEATNSEFRVQSSEFGERELTRYEIIKTIAPELMGKVVVSNLGLPSKELYSVLHQPSNFYMLGSMGMATPIGLGIALASKKEVVVIDGDGSLLMNPGTLATAAASAPGNLTILAIDNGVYGSTGDQATLAGSCVDLEAVARGFGIRNTYKVSEGKNIVKAFKDSQGSFSFIHALALPGNKDVPNIPLNPIGIRVGVQEFLKK